MVQDPRPPGAASAEPALESELLDAPPLLDALTLIAEREGETRDEPEPWMPDGRTPREGRKGEHD